MQAARWVLFRVALYALLAIVAVPTAGFTYSAVTGTSLSGSGHSAANLLAWLHVGVAVAVLGGCLTLIVLALVVPFRSRLSAIALKLLLLPFLLCAVLFVDLAGASPAFTLGLLGLQVMYLMIVR